MNPDLGENFLPTFSLRNRLGKELHPLLSQGVKTFDFLIYINGLYAFRHLEIPLGTGIGPLLTAFLNVRACRDEAK
jgi:hypothetical protein